MRTRVNFVMVPVTVKDSHGNLIPGLTYHDFQIYEDGVQQRLTSLQRFQLKDHITFNQTLPSPNT